MDQRAVETETIVALRRAGARFAFVHGSRTGQGLARAGSDLDVAAWWGRELLGRAAGFRNLLVHE